VQRTGEVNRTNKVRSQVPHNKINWSKMVSDKKEIEARSNSNGGVPSQDMRKTLPMFRSRVMVQQQLCYLQYNDNTQVLELWMGVKKKKNWRSVLYDIPNSTNIRSTSTYDQQHVRVRLVSFSVSLQTQLCSVHCWQTQLRRCSRKWCKLFGFPKTFELVAQFMSSFLHSQMKQFGERKTG